MVSSPSFGFSRAHVLNTRLLSLLSMQSTVPSTGLSSLSLASSRLSMISSVWETEPEKTSLVAWPNCSVVNSIRGTRSSVYFRHKNQITTYQIHTRGGGQCRVLPRKTSTACQSLTWFRSHGASGSRIFIEKRMILFQKIVLRS